MKATSSKEATDLLRECGLDESESANLNTWENEVIQHANGKACGLQMLAVYHTTLLSTC